MGTPGGGAEKTGSRRRWAQMNADRILFDGLARALVLSGLDLSLARFTRGLTDLWIEQLPDLDSKFIGYFFQPGKGGCVDSPLHQANEIHRVSGCLREFFLRQARFVAIVGYLAAKQCIEQSHSEKSAEFALKLTLS